MSVGSHAQRIRINSQARQNLPYILFIIVTMIAIGVAIQYDRMTRGTREIRTKAFTQTPTGTRLEAEEMTLSGSVTVDSTGTFLQF